MNAHVNYDLPQALLAVITDEEFGDPALLARRRPTTRRSTACSPPAVRRRGRRAGGFRSPAPCWTGVLTPLNRLGIPAVPPRGAAQGMGQRHRAAACPAAGPEAYAARLAELEELSAAKVADLQAPGQVLLTLAVTGFGVRLPG